MGVHPTAARGFEAAAAAYERARPGYPPETMAWLSQQLSLGPGMTVVDVAAGTGKLTRLLTSTGARVVAVEPAAAMRAALIDVVPEAVVLEGVAEALPVPDGSAQAATVAQAFHWFRAEEALAELHRVLAPEGALALVWNLRDLDQALQAAIEAVILPYRGDLPSHEGRAWEKPLAASPWFEPGDRHRTAWSQPLSRQGTLDRVASTSFIADLAEEERARVLARVAALVEDEPQPVAFDYITEAYVYRRR